MQNQESDSPQPYAPRPDSLSDEGAASPSISSAPGNDGSSRPPSASKKRASAPAAPAPVDRVGNSYRLTQADDWGIRFAALMLERQDGHRRSQQDLVDTAVREFLERLRKKGIQLPDSSTQ